MIKSFYIALFLNGSFSALAQENYLEYHQRVIQAEDLIASEKFQDALLTLEELFDNYEFIFLREYKLAAQLAVIIQDGSKALMYIKKGIAKGWSPQSVVKNKILVPLTKSATWESIKSNYSADPEHLEINYNLRQRVQAMYKKDQKKALGALFKVGNKAQEKYGNKKFAPHSEEQMVKLINILNEYGYPGEKLIGNDYWMSTILSHHNSLSEEYVKNDTLFQFIKPKLEVALEKGEISPFEFALISDWRMAVISNHKATIYGYLGDIHGADDAVKINNDRKNIGLRSIALRNKLLDLEKKYNFNCYLPGEPWQKGKITF
ncbi:MAG: hypothetical protein AAF843_13840 [Bacteroidota bacterium]